MTPRRGYAMVGAIACAIVAANAAIAQTPTQGEAIAITLKITPKVQTADFDKHVTLTGRVTGSATVAAALAAGDLDLEVGAIAAGYERPIDIEPITPEADGTFSRKLDVAVNARITLHPPEGSAFSGASPTVTTHWRPLPEVSNFTRGRKLVMEYRVSVPGGIPFSRGSLDIKRGTATKAVFYAGPKKAIPRLGTARLKSAYDGEVHARLAFPFSKLPPGGGRVYACVAGTAFLGTDPVDPGCGGKRSTGVIRVPD